MNPTKKLLNELDKYLESITNRFIERDIEPNFLAATVKIANPGNEEEKYIIETKKSVITLRYQEFSKTYYCHILNYQKQARKVCNDFIEIASTNKLESPKPILNSGQFAILYCESNTGIVLEANTLKRWIGWGNVYRVFQSDSEAIENAKFVSKGETIECTILDHNYDAVKVIGRWPSTNANSC